MGEEARDKTLRELFESDINKKLSSIVVLPTIHPFELKPISLVIFQSLEDVEGRIQINISKTSSWYVSR